MRLTPMGYTQILCKAGQILYTKVAWYFLWKIQKHAIQKKNSVDEIQLYVADKLDFWNSVFNLKCFQMALFYKNLKRSLSIKSTPHEYLKKAWCDQYFGYDRTLSGSLGSISCSDAQGLFEVLCIHANKSLDHRNDSICQACKEYVSHVLFEWTWHNSQKHEFLNTSKVFLLHL